MLKIDVEGIQRLDRTITDMMGTLKKFGNEEIQNEFFNWEAENLRRRAPWVRRIGRRKAFMTVVRPHSAASMKMRHRALVRWRRRHKGMVATGSTRPILRPSLWEELVKRMATLMETKIRWR